MDMAVRSFFPALVMILFYVFIGVAISRASKNKKKQQGSAPPPAGGENPGRERSPEKKTAQLEKEILSGSRATTLHPEEDLYRGSLGVVTDEGYDPCHEEQMQSMPVMPEAVLSEPAAEPASAVPGWTRNDIVRGFIVSEVRYRKRR